MSHLVLLGDSIFDNAAYTGRDPDVITHVRSILPAPWKATLRAVDGSITEDLPDQLPRVPEDASHLVVSIGGNDALQHTDLLDTPVRSTAEALELFGERVQAFEESYRQALGEVLRLERPTVVCTEPEDYANPIEPSGQGGAKIARARVGLLQRTAAGSRS